VKTCDKCGQQNPEEALFCQQCGTPLSAASLPPALENEQQIWRAFIGPSKALLFSLNTWWSWHRADDYYMEQFRKFSSSGAPRFALSWHWPAFLVDPFLWFLYRKMYLYAVVYAVGPVVSAYATGDFTVGLVWRIMAGVSANYIYYWHVKEHVATIRAKSHLDGAAQERLLRDLGGVQPYVIWLGVILHILLIAMMIIAAREGPPPDGGKDQPNRSKPAAIRTIL
jgi:hypothetical protein